MYVLKVDIPTQTIGFYNKTDWRHLSIKSKVVIPTQTIGFYNAVSSSSSAMTKVVIPTQKIGFYN